MSRAPENGAPERAATIYAVAQEAGVSTATVSRALGGSDKVAPRTREAVFAAARALNYVPEGAARALAGRRSHALGLVLPHIDGPYYAAVLVGFEMAASQLGLSVVLDLAGPDTEPEREIRRLAGTVDGVAFMARSAVEDSLIAEIGARRPVVTAARARVPGRDAFYTENTVTAARLTAHLVESGRTRCAFVGRPEPDSDMGARHEGFLSALADAGLKPVATFAADPVEEAGAQVARELLAEGTAVDALVCGNDQLALAVMHELQDAGVDVPGQIAIVGWDDVHAARYVRPGLTTVAQPVEELGALAAHRLAALVDGADPDPEPVVLGSTIVHRGSCGCPHPGHGEGLDPRPHPQEQP
ncbi:LacI family DNA-binding transcriptional regulator [Brachybacterium saurashtrense]|uniref:LacI family transcriptional regulator n=1 Tax=Brachybacterium saurashtrense TaxID=556288 RepID=A0A345YRV5_9MICO|nr:LacI family DNA-binding transcriptional regulator [Brachybacterium saurashtrense]AXK46657.1 LacI family transcriptional regulator [Brachybacterium saurashtrense]RRR22371.1 LacI family transcriptional regulator [Brachybacterium saurashtrense]